MADKAPRTEAHPGRMPVVFAGHGSPMNAVEANRWSRGFTTLRDLVPRPRAILAVSAHWYIDGTFLTGDASPRTIHDFNGFPAALYEIQYPATGKVSLAKRVRDLLGDDRAALNSQWGFDHGTWSVLRWMYPQAEVPVIQISIDRRLDVHAHFALGRSLAELREEGILILGSGNVVHNLRDAFTRRRTGSLETPDWARRYDESIKDILTQRGTDALLRAWPDSDDGRQAHPTPDHWLPLIYTYAATDERDRCRFSSEGFDWGSISMRNVVWG